VSGLRPVRLYDFPFSGNAYKARLALAQLGLEVEYTVVDILAGQSRTPQFLAMNPMGQIPVLELSDGTFLSESNAILCWLTEGTPLMPTSRLDRTRVIQWMCFEQSNIDKVIGRAKFMRAHPHFRDVAPEEFEEWWRQGREALAVLETHLAANAWLVGGIYSAADICLYGYVHGSEDAGIALAPYPAVRAWLDRVRRQPRHIGINDAQPPPR
jgi:glutathione S-transferase